jgi:hypothetical protein
MRSTPSAPTFLRSGRWAAALLLLVAWRSHALNIPGPDPDLFGVTGGEDRGVTRSLETLVETGLWVPALGLFRDASYGLEQTERAAWILGRPDGDVAWARWPATFLNGMEEWKGPVPDGAIGIVHTHPQLLDPLPSHADSKTARDLQMSVYTVSRRGIWKVTPRGEVVQVADHMWMVRAEELSHGAATVAKQARANEVAIP